jgi:hypothetical protein
MPGSVMRPYAPAPAPVPQKRSMPKAPILIVVAVLAGWFGFRMLTGVSVSVPDEIDGVALMTDGPIVDAADQSFEQSGLNGLEAKWGLYGTSQIPEFLFVAAKGTESSAEDGQALQSVSDGLGSGGALGLDLENVTTEQVDGVTYNCAPLTGQGITGSACLWNDGKTLGAVLWFQDRGVPTEFASHVHDAVVS